MKALQTFDITATNHPKNKQSHSKRPESSTNANIQASTKCMHHKTYLESSCKASVISLISSCVIVPSGAMLLKW